MASALLSGFQYTVFRVEGEKVSIDGQGNFLPRNSGPLELAHRLIVPRRERKNNVEGSRFLILQYKISIEEGAWGGMIG